MGVSKAAKNTLNKNPFINRVENISQDKTLNIHSRNNTEKVSIN